MRQYSTTAKYKGFTELLMTIAQMTTYPNEKVERTVKMLGVQSDNKEDSKNRANNLTTTMRRDLKLTNEAIAKGKAPSKCQRYSVCKEYLTVEEVSKRIKENKENLENPHRTYIEKMAELCNFCLTETPESLKAKNFSFSCESFESPFKYNTSVSSVFPSFFDISVFSNLDPSYRDW